MCSVKAEEDKELSGWDLVAHHHERKLTMCFHEERFGFFFFFFNI